MSRSPSPIWLPVLASLAALLVLAACEVPAESFTDPPDCTVASDAGDGALSAVCPGAEWPSWQLADFQPQSPKFQQTYGLDAFQGKAVLVALFSAS